VAEVKTRISGRVRVAVTAMVETGLSRSAAASAAGLTDHGLYQALRKPLVLELLRTLQEVKRTSAGSRTIARAEVLADSAQSEHVRLQANEWLGGIAGIAPISKSEIDHRHSGMVPGLVIVTGGWQPHQAEQLPDMIDVTPAPRPYVQVIGKSVPHPLALQKTEGKV
jgi:hypothetical protein